MSHNDTTTAETLEGGNNDGAIFVGTEEGERVYWDYRTNELVKPEHPNDPHALGDEWVGEYLAESRGLGMFTPNGTVGEFLTAVAEKSSVPGGLGEREATVYALVELVGLRPYQVANALGNAESTVYNTRTAAAEKIEAFRAVVDTVGE